MLYEYALIVANAALYKHSNTFIVWREPWCRLCFNEKDRTF